MLKVLIIDDEPIVRAGLKKIIAWKENGFEICGEGFDYNDGLKKIQELNPDIVLTDIKMPGGFGTDLIKEALEKNFKGKFIIVSGYSNFEYAKKAIKYGVKSYILKPIDEDELLDILLELKEDFKNERKLESNKVMLKEFELEQYILKQREEIDDSYLKYDSFQIALVSYKRIDDSEMSTEGLKNSIKDRLTAYGDIDVVIIEENIVILFKGFNISRTVKTLKTLYNVINDELQTKAFITLGSNVESCNDIRDTYYSAKRLMKQRFLYLEKGVLYEEILEDDSELDLDSLELQLEISKIYSYVEVNDLEKLQLETQKIGQYIRKNIYSEQQIKIMSVKVFLELKEKLMKDYDSNKLISINNEEVMSKIHSQESLNSILEYMLKEFSFISKKIGGISSDSIIKRVMNYMEKNYYKDLKLETLAEIFNYNSAYLGKLFKSVVGENFNTYLDKIRIEQAKALLLEEKYKVYQVCERVGYKNIDYFHSKFKKYVGTSPLNYKKQNENKN